MSALLSVKRWFVMRFRTRVEFRPDPFGRPECWHVSRPDWWSPGCRSGIGGVSPEAARAALDDWQDKRSQAASQRRGEGGR